MHDTNSISESENTIFRQDSLSSKMFKYVVVTFLYINDDVY